jgi:hypothetical protein
MPTELQLPFLQSAVVPMVLSIVLMALGWWRSTHASAAREARRAPLDERQLLTSPMPGDVASLLAGAVTFGIVAIVTSVWVLWTPGLFDGAARITSAEKWIPWIAIVGCVVAVIDAALPRTLGVALPLRVALVVVIAAFGIVSSFVGGGAWRWPSAWADILTIAMAIGFGLALWLGLSRVIHRVRGVEAGLTVVILATAISVALAASGSAKLAQICGALGAAGGGACIVALFRPRLALLGVASVAAPLLGALLYQGVRYTDNHTPGTLVVFVLPGALLVSAWLAGRDQTASGTSAIATRLGLLSVAAVVVVGVIAMNVPRVEEYVP